MPTAEKAPPIPDASPAADDRMSEFGDIPYQVEVLVGSAVRTLGAILKLKPGDVIELNRPAHEGVVLAIREVPIAQAEVVASEKGVRIQITEVGNEEA